VFRKFCSYVLFLVLIITLAGCTKKTVTGAAIGTVVGTTAGALINPSDPAAGAMAGMVAGGVIGCVASHVFEKKALGQEEALQEQEEESNTTSKLDEPYLTGSFVVGGRKYFTESIEYALVPSAQYKKYVQHFCLKHPKEYQSSRYRFGDFIKEMMLKRAR